MEYLEATSRAHITAAEAPSLVGQHWYRVRGSAIILEFSMSSIVKTFWK